MTEALEAVRRAFQRQIQQARENLDEGDPQGNENDGQNHITNPVGVMQPMMIDNSRRFERLLSRPIVLTTQYSGMVLAQSKLSSIEEWDDIQPGARLCYNLQLYEDDAELIIVAERTFASIQGNITARSICTLMNIAYNMKDAQGNLCYGAIPLELVANDRDFEEISDDVIHNVRPARTLVCSVSQDDPNYNAKLARGFSYLAASYLRLYTKSAENYFLIDTHLRNRFTNFYDFPFPFDFYHPSREAIGLIKSQIELNIVLRNTFYNFLYAGEGVQAGKQVKEFLYGIHVAYTGMHSYVLFLKCLEVYKIDNRILASSLFSMYFQTELDALAKIFNELYRPVEAPNMNRQMWRYARIFETRFFNQLQTKHSALFTGVLAYLYHFVVPATGTQDAKRIARVAALSRTHKTLAEGYAIRARQIIHSQVFTANYEGIDDILRTPLPV